MTALNAPTKERSHFWPVLLPDEKHFLYCRMTTGSAGLYVRSLDAKPAAADARSLGQVGLVYGYVASPDADAGWVLLQRQNSLVAQPFDGRRLEFRGEATVVAEQVGTIHGTAQASSANGVVVYGSPGSTDVQLIWVGRKGNVLGPAGEPGRYPPLTLAVSPDAARVAITRGYPARANLWVLDLSRGSSSRLTFGSYVDELPVWSPDGSRIAFKSSRGGGECG